LDPRRALLTPAAVPEAFWPPVAASRPPLGPQLLNLLSSAVKKAGGKALDAQHFGGLARVGEENPEELARRLFANLVGLRESRDMFERYARRVQRMRHRGDRKVPDLGFRFVGPPGTGKTTVARKLGEMLYELGLLATANFVEQSPGTLVGQYVGHAPKNVDDAMEKALGGVLFIDEVYGLNECHFGKKVVDQLVNNLTLEKYKGKIAVVIAGYERDVDRFLATNDGLSRRLPEEVRFEKFTRDESVDVLRNHIAQNEEDIVLDAGISNDQLSEVLGPAVEHPQFSSGGTLKQIFDRLQDEATARAGVDDVAVATLTDVKDAVRVVLSKMPSTDQRSPADDSGPSHAGPTNASTLPPEPALPIEAEPPSVATPPTMSPGPSAAPPHEAPTGTVPYHAEGNAGVPPGPSAARTTGDGAIQVAEDTADALHQLVSDEVDVLTDSETVRMVAQVAQAAGINRPLLSGDLQNDVFVRSLAAVLGGGPSWAVKAITSIIRDSAMLRERDKALRKTEEEARRHAEKLRKAAEDEADHERREVLRAATELVERALRRVKENGLCPAGFQWLKRTEGW